MAGCPSTRAVPLDARHKTGQTSLKIAGQLVSPVERADDRANAMDMAAAHANNTAQPFVHLRVHSAYSLLEGALTIQKLAALARPTMPRRSR